MSITTIRSTRVPILFPLGISLALGVALALVPLHLLSGASSSWAAPSAELHVCPGACPYASVQAAVDAAQPGDVIKVAEGTYTDVHVRAGITQVVYISKSVTVRGGYTPDEWITPDPTANVTTLDAQGLGRVVVVSDTAHVTLEGLAITGGDAGGLAGTDFGDDAGGGLYVNTVPGIKIRGCTIYSNTAMAAGWCCGRGGGLFLLRSDDAVVERNAIHGNWGSRAGFGDGGGMYVYLSDRLRLSGNTIHHNTATKANGAGGGLFISSSEHAVLEQNVIRDNVTSVGADAWGGGVYMAYTDHALVTGNVIRDNVASRFTWGHGGGMVIYGSADALFADNVIVGNDTSSNRESGFGGGGVYLELSNPTFVNTVLADNWGSDHGSGVYVTGGSPTFLHTTFARNGGTGGGLFVDSWNRTAGSAALTNTIMYGHSVGVTVTSGNTVTLHSSLWEANGADWAGSGAVLHTGDHSGDPAFAADGYHLTDESAAIDLGVDADVHTDLDGDDRPQRAGYDIGADEYMARVYLPVVMRPR